MKTITAAAQSVLDVGRAIDAQIIVKIEWASPFSTTYYGAKTFDLPDGSTTIPVLGRVGDISEIVNGVGPKWGPAAASAQLKLIDPDGLLYLRYLTTAVEQVPITVYLYVAGTEADDLIELVRGVAGSPITYIDNEGALQIDIVSPIRSTPLSYTLDQDLDDDVPDESDGAVVPLAMGYPRDVPAVLYRRGPDTRTIHDFDSSDTKIEVEDGSKFPAGVLTLRIEDEMVTATIAGDEITASARNVQKFSNLKTATRPSNDVDKDNPFVLWCADESKDHVGNYVVIESSQVPGTNGSVRANYCVAQKGTKLVFEKPWTAVNKGLWLVPAGIQYDVKRYDFVWVDTLAANANQWQTQAGARVTCFADASGASLEYAEYLASAVASDSVVRVRAYRTYQQGKLGLTERRLVTVPSSLYSWSNANVLVANGSGSLVNITATKIRFSTALGMLNQGWDDSAIFVTMKSSIGKNIADQIEWLLQNRTNATVNAASFAAAQTALSKYRADFAITEDVDALTVAHDLAWQARSALLLQGPEAKLVYLSATPSTASFQLKELHLARDSYMLELSEIEDIETILRATWRLNGTGEKERRLRQRKNVTKFGARTAFRDIWAFAKRSLVRKTADFWNKRNSRAWRRVAGESHHLATVALDPLDTVSVQLPFSLLTNGTIGRVLRVVYKPKPHTIALSIWLPIESGALVQSSNAYLDDSSDAAIADPTVKAAKQIIARTAPFGFSTIAESFQTAVPVKILKVITAKTAEIEIYPTGLNSTPSGTAFLTVLSTPQAANWAVGKTGLAWQLPAGDFVSDVFAST